MWGALRNTYKKVLVQNLSGRVEKIVKGSLDLIPSPSPTGALNLHLLEFTFIYQFYSRKTILVELIF